MLEHTGLRRVLEKSGESWWRPSVSDGAGYTIKAFTTLIWWGTRLINSLNSPFMSSSSSGGKTWCLTSMPVGGVALSAELQPGLEGTGIWGKKEGVVGRGWREHEYKRRDQVNQCSKMSSCQMVSGVKDGLTSSSSSSSPSSWRRSTTNDGKTPIRPFSSPSQNPSSTSRTKQSHK